MKEGSFAAHFEERKSKFRFAKPSNLRETHDGGEEDEDYDPRNCCNVGPVCEQNADGRNLGRDLSPNLSLT